MIHGYINGQGLRLMTDSVIVADTIDYLEAEFNFTPDWEGLAVWAHFRQGDGGYSILLTDNRIKKTDHLTLGEGEWSVFLHGCCSVDGVMVTRITTEAQTLSVLPCGALEGEPFGEVPVTEVERLAALIGNTDDLETDTKTTLVGAINEANRHGGGGGAGQNGLSAYELAVQEGFTGTLGAWLASLKGEDGRDGADGAPGRDGADGSKGEKGDKGEPGEKGDKGDKGDPGADGAPGVKGDKGDPGAKGDKGDPGAKGDKGDPGADGAPGAKGDKGDPGEDGAPGAKGDKGDKGDPGPAYVLTASDTEAIKQAVLSALPTWEGGSY